MSFGRYGKNFFCAGILLVMVVFAGAVAYAASGGESEFTSFLKITEPTTTYGVIISKQVKYTGTDEDVRQYLEKLEYTFLIEADVKNLKDTSDTHKIKEEATVKGNEEIFLSLIFSCDKGTNVKHSSENIKITESANIPGYNLETKTELMQITSSSIALNQLVKITTNENAEILIYPDYGEYDKSVFSDKQLHYRVAETSNIDDYIADGNISFSDFEDALIITDANLEAETSYFIRLNALDKADFNVKVDNWPISGDGNSAAVVSGMPDIQIVFSGSPLTRTFEITYPEGKTETLKTVELSEEYVLAYLSTTGDYTITSKDGIPFTVYCGEIEQEVNEAPYTITLEFTVPDDLPETTKFTITPGSDTLYTYNVINHMTEQLVRTVTASNSAPEELELPTATYDVQVVDHEYIYGAVVESYEIVQGPELIAGPSGIAKAVFTNIYTRDPNTCDLVVSKKVSDNSTTDTFHFKVTLNDSSINGVYYEMEFENGVAEFDLKHGESKKAVGLPKDVQYTVTETHVDGYTATYTTSYSAVPDVTPDAIADGTSGSGETVTGTIPAGNIAEVVFTNSKDIPQEPGNLTVKKTVTGTGANLEDAFTFTVTLSDKTITGTYGDMAFTNGVATFNLKHNESKTAEGLPAGVTYEVEEDSAGYNASYQGESGTITAGGTQTAAFTNKRDKPEDPPPSGGGPSYGTYKYVHEYYYKDKDGNLTLEGTSNISKSDNIKLPDTNTYDESDVKRVYTFTVDGVEYTYEYLEDAYGKTSSSTTYKADSSMDYVVATTTGNQIIILRYVRTDEPESEQTGGYRFVHEYYFEDADGNRTLEGVSSISTVDGLALDTEYTESSVERVYTFGGNEYRFMNYGYGLMDGSGYNADDVMVCVITTETNEQIIILRYVRTAEPVIPPPPPEDEEEEEEDEDEDEDEPTELPDPNDPDSPEEITIWDDDVPTTYIKIWDPEEEEWIYVPEDEVPLANLEIPETGDRMGLWAVLAAASLAGVSVLTVVERKKK